MKKRTVALLMALVLCAGCAVGGTVAWLVDRTEPLLNTFTPSNIDITLHESIIDLKTGLPTTDSKGNTITYEGNGTDDEGIKLLPGQTITKDPTITVKAGSVDCYVRMYVVLEWPAAADSAFGGVDASDWIAKENTDKWSIEVLFRDTWNDFVGQDIFEFRYNEKISTSTTDFPVPRAFSELQIPGNLTNYQIEALEDAKIHVVAQAVQASGFANADAAFEAAGHAPIIADWLTSLNAALEEFKNEHPDQFNGSN